MSVTKWDVFDACDQREWRRPALITRRVTTSCNRHVSLAEVFMHLEALEDAGHLESRKEGSGPIEFRKTLHGTRARIEAEQKQAAHGFGSLVPKPA